MWQSLPGVAYQLQYTTNVPAAAWIDFGAADHGHGPENDRV